MTCLMEGKKAAGWYKKVCDAIKGERVLEVGVGTGRSFQYYPRNIKATAIDLSDGMLAKAKRRAAELGLNVDLKQMGVQKLEFPDNSFDTVVAQCTFCSVPDPVLGLQEIRRVLKPGGRALFLEHMRHENKVIGKLMDWINSITSRMMGPNINRRTLDNIRKAGLEIETVENLAMGGIMKFIIARKGEETIATEK
ncbi:MAG: class I SAM-dependent methyltransferase [Chloroflexi bacterium]|nr:class I SAM-dependent methyltransferase [Chloroflexota bacterium]